MAPVFRIFSDPARSTKYNFPLLQVESSLLVCLILMIKIVCEREDLAFILVELTARFSLPRIMIVCTSD